MNHEMTTKFYEYNLWANTVLIDLLTTLSDEQLEAKAGGVVGTLRETITHLVRAEGYYIRHLSGNLPEWGVGEEMEAWLKLSMQELLVIAKMTGGQLIELAVSAELATRHDREYEGKPFHFHNWTVILQAIYHGIEHRTQIKAILTELGIKHPEMASWDYTGQLLGYDHID